MLCAKRRAAALEDSRRNDPQRSFHMHVLCLWDVDADTRAFLNQGYYILYETIST